jgi:hypothetical protein
MISTLIASTTPSSADAIAGGLTGIALFLVIALAIALGVAIYLLPSIIGFARQRPNAVPILVLNVFLGWSLLGWVAALVWSLAVDQPVQQVFINQAMPAGGPTAAERM